MGVVLTTVSCQGRGNSQKYRMQTRTSTDLHAVNSQKSPINVHLDSLLGGVQRDDFVQVTKAKLKKCIFKRKKLEQGSESTA